jgi:sugar phosphate isomerase/epimerase
MDIGIMDLQIGALLGGEPGAATNPLAQLAGFDHTSLVARLNDAGFNPIELTGDMGIFLPQAFAAPAIESLARLKAERGLRYTVHLPLWSIEPSTPQQPVRVGSVQALVESVRSTLPLEPEMYVLHATGALAAEFYRMRLPEEVRALILRLFQANAQESVRALLAETGLPSRRLALETIEFPFDLTLEIAEALDTSICVDTGHVLSGFSGDLDLFAVLERVQPRLGEIHLHDSPHIRPPKIEYGKDHQPLGTADLDVPRLLAWLEAHAYAGPVILELTVEEAQASLRYLRGLARPA